ncbi:MAG: winged helix-turn-helix domain-containing protein [Bacteroidia bacterium]|nr:winged helix-turn-helix domain-containing protein [Bacteroidia bacterium]
MLVFFFVPLICWSATIEEINEKRTKVVMRMIGHEILTNLSDTTSRVLPIEKSDNEYRIAFDTEFEFEAEIIVAVVDSNMAKSGITSDYLVEVVSCESENVVYSYTIGNAVNPNFMPCAGRVYPEDCYFIVITVLDVKNLESDMASGEDQDLHIPLYKSLFSSVFLILPVIFVIGLISYLKRKKRSVPVNPNLISIGATLFDKRNMTLSYNNESIDLSSKEAELLTVLNESVNETIDRNEILKKVWGDEGDYVGRTLDVFISKLRKKLDGDESVKIVNARGIGYKLVVG